MGPNTADIQTFVYYHFPLLTKNTHSAMRVSNLVNYLHLLTAYSYIL